MRSEKWGVERKRKKKKKRSAISERMRARGPRGQGSLAGQGQRPCGDAGGWPTAGAEPRPVGYADRACKISFDSKCSWANSDGVNSLYSPIPDVSRSSFRSFGFASLVGRCPTPRKGAALDPPGGPVPDDACRHRLDSHARIRSLVMRCAMLFLCFFVKFSFLSLVRPNVYKFCGQITNL